jgi:hypothetical protein
MQCTRWLNTGSMMDMTCNFFEILAMEISAGKR